MKKFIIYQGESRALDYIITDARGAPVDLTYYVARWRMTRRFEQVALLDKSLGDGIEYIDVPGGRLAVTLRSGVRIAPGSLSSFIL